MLIWGIHPCDAQANSQLNGWIHWIWSKKLNWETGIFLWTSPEDLPSSNWYKGCCTSMPSRVCPPLQNSRSVVCSSRISSSVLWRLKARYNIGHGFESRRAWVRIPPDLPVDFFSLGKHRVYIGHVGQSTSLWIRVYPVKVTPYYILSLIQGCDLPKVKSTEYTVLHTYVTVRAKSNHVFITRCLQNFVCKHWSRWPIYLTLNQSISSESYTLLHLVFNAGVWFAKSKKILKKWVAGLGHPLV